MQVKNNPHQFFVKRSTREVGCPALRTFLLTHAVILLLSTHKIAQCNCYDHQVIQPWLLPYCCRSLPHTACMRQQFLSDVQGSCQQKQDGRRKRELPEDVEEEVHEDAESVKDADFMVGARSKKHRGVDEVHTVPVTSTDAPTEG